MYSGTGLNRKVVLREEDEMNFFFESKIFYFLQKNPGKSIFVGTKINIFRKILICGATRNCPVALRGI